MVQLPPLSLALPAIKLAIEQGRLQADTQNGKTITYSGPCAVGFVLPPEHQAVLDKGATDGSYAIYAFAEEGSVKVFEDDSIEDWVTLQEKHDSLYTATLMEYGEANILQYRQRFIDTVDRLILKYPVFPSQQ